MKFLTVLLLAAVSISSAELTLKITGIHPEQGGSLIVFLYQNATWMKLKTPTGQIPLNPEMKSTQMVLKNIPAGEYAVQVIHDRDKNGKLTMKWTPPGPIEGYGFSAGYRPSSIPKYKPASLIIRSDTTLQIDLTYPGK